MTVKPPSRKIPKQSRKQGRSALGSATLAEHLRELRSRLIKSILAVVAFSVVGWVYYDELFTFLRAPIEDLLVESADTSRDVRLVLAGVTDPFVLRIKVSITAGLVLSSPVWIYQIWRFVTPGLHKNERRWAIAVTMVSVPLFLSGVGLAYVVLPIALQVLLGFTPEGVANYVPVDRYLTFFLRVALVFGIGFLAPAVFLFLNLAGVVTGRQMLGWWRIIIMVTLIFGAVASPTGDPVNLLVLTVPMLALIFIVIGLALLNDMRRRNAGIAKA
jgi:sec-independent protein translocase protein TatC